MSLVGSKIAEPYAEALVDLAAANDSLKDKPAADGLTTEEGS